MPPDIYEKIAARTKNWLALAPKLDVRIGEETLTDTLALEFCNSGTGVVKVFQTTKALEYRTGTDLEFRIWTEGSSAYIFSVQAKKMYPGGKYPHLNQRAGRHGPRQIDVLENWASAVGSVPLYLLYNDPTWGEAKRSWSCCSYPPDCQSRLGCSLVPSWVVRDRLSRRGQRTFERIHDDPAALPWRCYFKCHKSEKEGGWAYRFQQSVELLESTSRIGPMADFVSPQLYPIEGAWPQRLWGEKSQIDILSEAEIRTLWGDAIATDIDPPRTVILLRDENVARAAA